MAEKGEPIEAGRLHEYYKTLQDVVNIREGGRKTPEDFAELGDHSVKEIRASVIKVFEHLADTGEAESAGRTIKITKEVPGGSIIMEMFYDDAAHKFPRMIEFRIDGNIGGRTLEVDLPLTETGDRGNGFFVNESSFTDTAVGHSYLPEQKQMNPKDAKFVLRGARTLIANLINWDEKGMVYPDELDKNLISQSI